MGYKVLIYAHHLILIHFAYTILIYFGYLNVYNIFNDFDVYTKILHVIGILVATF